ncbi:hypothetical protein BJ944DRAFT_250680 [Cunninghamella echinulata]|nr:hypothetical protein BJ944DRAFT_250680 [Cunninghamella echinulata]
MVTNSTTSKLPFGVCHVIFACEDAPGLPVHNAKSPTGLILQLVLCSSVGFVCFLLFCYLRVRWPSMYAPRLSMKKHAPQPLPTSFLGWILPVLKTPNTVVLEKVGLDAVIMLQFLLMGAKLFALCGFFGTVVLYPISRMGGDLLNSTNPNDTHRNTSLYETVIADPATSSNSFLWVYLFFTYFFCLATFYFTFLNYRDYVRFRQEFMLRIGKSIPSRTVLVTGIPPSLRTDQKLAEYFEQLGIGVVESVHIIKHVSRLMDLIKERAKYLRLLENAYTRYWGNPCNDPSYDPDFLLAEAEQDQRLRALSWSAASSILQQQQRKKNQKKNQNNPTIISTSPSSSLTSSISSLKSDDEGEDDNDSENEDDIRQPLLPTHNHHHQHSKLKQKQHKLFSKMKKKAKEPLRPLAKDGFLGMVGKNVDAIEYFTEKYNQMDTKVFKARRYGKFLPTSVGFVTFEEPMSATITSQVLIDSTPFRLNAQQAPEPRDVLWENIAMHGRERLIRKGLIFGIQILLVFFWVIPISFFSALTSENSLKYYFPWLMDLASKNKILQQVIQSFLPTLGVVIFTAFLPMILHALSIIEGFPTRSEAEESTFSKHFFFLLFNVLLVFTLSSTLFKTLHDILEDPTQLANILAINLPKVAPFFVNYIVMHGMMLLPIQLLQIGPVILQLFHRVFTCRTPRDYAEVLAPRMYNYGWGYPIPVFVFVVLLVYSTITPLILVFGALYFCLSYLVFKYQLLYVYFHPYEVAGRMWPLVFSRIIVGLLIFEVLAAGLFVLNKAYTLAVLCTPLVGLTVLFNFGMDRAYQSSTQHIPIKLLSQRFGPLKSTVTRPPSPAFANETNPEHLITSTTTSMNNNNTAYVSIGRRRRAVLDEDDFEAEGRKYTNFKEPPMTLLDGILNTGMKRYAHPAFLGVLPSLWLPNKAKKKNSFVDANDQVPLHIDPNGVIQPTEDTNEPTIVSSPIENTNRDLLAIKEEEHEEMEGQQNKASSSTSPTTKNQPIPTRNISQQRHGSINDMPSDDDEVDSLEDGLTYYHHPERKLSRSISKSYGSTGKP